MPTIGCFSNTVARFINLDTGMLAKFGLITLGLWRGQDAKNTLPVGNCLIATTAHCWMAALSRTPDAARDRSLLCICRSIQNGPLRSLRGGNRDTRRNLSM